MIKFRFFIAAVGVVLAVTSAPALAKSRAVHPGYAARAQAIENVIDGVTLERAKVLRECNDRVVGFKDYTWGNTQADLYRSCMSQHGQPE